MKRAFIVLMLILVLICAAAFADEADTAVLQSTMKVSMKTRSGQPGKFYASFSQQYMVVL